jgi:hypothetical protein
VAVVFVAAAVLLLALREREPAPPRSRVVLSRQEQVARVKKRATLQLPPVGEPPAAAAPPKRDPLLVALPVKPDAPVVMLEVNALRYSRLGERFLSCVQARDQGRFANIVRETGIDPLKDIDRVALVGDSIVVSGQLERARWSELGGPADPYGQTGRIYKTPRGVVGTWGDQIAILSSSPESIHAAIDQLEGRAPAPETGISEDESYGEIYGFVPGAALRAALGSSGGGGGLTDRIASLASRIDLHVDAADDVAAEVHIRGDDPAGLADLAKEVGAALAAGRASGDKKVAALLANTEVHTGERELSVRLAVPAARVEDLLGDCESFGPPSGGAISTASR